jgi:hypothetical protein
MTLEKILRIKEIKENLLAQGFMIEKSNIGIEFVSVNNLIIAIHKQTHVLDGEEPLIYLDCPLSLGYGLPDLKRIWHEKDNITDYLLKICVPYVKNLKGPCTIEKKEVKEIIANYLSNKKITYSYFETAELIYTRVDSLGRIYIEKLNDPQYQFIINKSKYGVLFHNSYIEVFKFDKCDENLVLYEYPWYSFCPVSKGGNEYVETTLQNFLDFVKNE